jgi:ankyrin repeat protein
MKKALCIIALCHIFMCCGEQEDTGTQLFKAIQENNTEKVQELLSQGIDINSYTSEFGDLPLLYAITYGSVEMVNLLLDKGAQPGPSRPGDHWSDMSIITAIYQNKMDIAETLIKRGVGADAKSIRKSTLLIYASCKGYTKLVEAFLNSGRIDINHRGGYFNHTALQRAKEQGHEEIVILLTDAGAEE